VRLQPEVEPLRVLRIVVVLFPLDARIRKMLDRTPPGRGCACITGEYDNGEPGI